MEKTNLLEQSVFPDWFSICMAIMEKIPELKKINKRFYHYTSIEGFMSILQNRDFWISNIHFMNDSQEFENGKKICQSMVREKLEGCDLNTKRFLEKILKICESNQSRGFNAISSKDIYALSFCKEGDILSQWQFYGNNGVAIGFENGDNINTGIALMNEDEYMKEIETILPEEMMPHNELQLFPIDIIYDDCIKKKIIKEILDIGIRFYEKGGDNVLDMSVAGVSDALFYYFTLMKDKHFNHEDEKRFLYYTDKDNNSRVHFRKRGNILLPYKKMKILDYNCRLHNKFPVFDIVIAPSSQAEYVKKSVIFFLEKSGYDYLVEKVRISEIPYRE